MSAHPLRIVAANCAETAATHDVRGGLATVVAGLDAAFDATGHALADAIGQIDEIVAALGQVAQVFTMGEAATAVDDLTRAARALLGVTDQIDARAVEMAAIDQANRALRRETHDVTRCLRVLEIYGMNVKITASGLPQFVEFADRMRGRLNGGIVQVSDLESGLTALSASLGQMQHIDGLLRAECGKVLPAVPDRLVADANAFRQHQDDMARLALAVSDIARDIQGQLAMALGAIQVGDRARQRLEHVIFGFDLLERTLADLPEHDAQGPALRSVMHPLLAGLTAAAGDEYDRDAHTLAASLERLDESAQRLIALHAQGGQSGDGGFLARLEAGVADAAGMIEQLGKANRQGVATMEVIRTTVQDVAAKVSSITELRLDVRHMSINIGLSSRSLEKIARPVMVIANDIRAHSDMLDVIIGSMGMTQDRLVESAGRLGQSGSDGEGGQSLDLARFLSAVHHGAEQIAQSAAGVEERVMQVRRLLLGTQDDMARAVDFGVQMANLARHFPPDAGGPAGVSSDAAAIAAVQAVIDQLSACYTMADEREVHNALLPGGIAPIAIAAAPASVAIDDDDDDGLF